MKDLIIIGAGPIGLACAIEAKKKGLTYLVIEKNMLTNSIYHYPLNMTFFSTSERLEIGGVPFISHNPKPTRAEALEYYRRVAMSHALNIQLYEEVIGITKTKEGVFHLQTSNGEYNAKNIAIATGFYDHENKMNIPGEELPKVHHYYRDPHPYFNQNVAIIGARNSAVDAALDCYRKGAKQVTMIIRESEISSRVKYWVKPDIENRIKEGSISAFFNATLSEITSTEVVFIQNNQEKRIANDFVLAMTGYKPNFDLLRQAGVHLDEKNNMIPHYNSETMESNVEGLYLAGVVCGGLETHKWFIENSREHAPKIVNHITSE